MKKRTGVMLSLALAAGTLLTACGKDDKAADDKKFKVAMVTDTGGVDDKSFNQSAWEGLQKFGADNKLKSGSDFKYLQSNSPSDYAPNLNKLVRDKYDIVYGIGFLMENDIKKVADQQPKGKLAIVDTVVDKKNVASIVFKENEGSFLVGLIAGMQTKSNKVGFVGGVESPLIKKFENGFKAGVKMANPKAEIMIQYAGDFNKAEKGLAIANTFYGKGADIIYHAAGGTGKGIFTEAKNRAKNGKKVWVIGVDRDQFEEGQPQGVTLTSMVKRVDIAVQQVSKDTKEGHFPGGKVVEFGLDKDAVSIAPHKENVSKDALAKVDEFKKKIKDGELKVPKDDKEYEEFLKTLKK
ncbi:putative ABC-type transport system periplasmic component/surface lipoprotein-like protein [Fictibacillus macauensis ZFHKF-1]|uniref:Putative ABC-type transport system periplasmic component/surface lipoprotein-like protein n=1 Tax=Fictibacillus macauensis ZFHKF-1 TaxID=1196324 RepID=I8AI55_9BACL|nr:BMP family ABC transporter substrate-binding protein [Fictibacillus macauensis]EIT85139.1 putative ABC-type transport system periplasmic component/surface lipoprotein-like protein [Fictibacillus macauensis ZFHKF-1]